MRRLLCLPFRSLLEKWMLRVRWNHDHCALIVQKLGDSFFGSTRSRESTIEDVTLPLDFTGDCLDAKKNSRHRVGKLDAVEMSSNQSHPCLAARGRTRRTHEMLVYSPVREREHERHLARAKSLRFERGRHIVDESVDDEHEPLGVRE